MDSNYTAKIICEKRKSKNLTQKDIAEKLNVSVSAVSKWERGLNFPDLYLMEPLAMLLDISVVTLLGLENEPTETVIKNITEISEKEKEASKYSFIRRMCVFTAAIIIFIFALFVILHVVRFEGVIDSLNLQQNGMYLSFVALLLGFVSWGTAVLGIFIKKENEKSKLFSTLSYIFCSLSLYFPILIFDICFRTGDSSAVEDTVTGFNFGALVLLAGTILINLCRYVINKKDK